MFMHDILEENLTHISGHYRIMDFKILERGIFKKFPHFYIFAAKR